MCDEIIPPCNDYSGCGYDEAVAVQMHILQLRIMHNIK